MKDGVSGRQMAAAAFAGLLAPAAALAGQDWRGTLLAVPVLLLIGCCWERIERRGMPRRTEIGRAFSALYLVWAVMTAGTVLASAGGRMDAPDGSDTGWVILLIWLPVLLLTRKGAAAYGRAAEIFCLGMLAALVFVLVLGSRQIKVERLLKEAEGLWESFVSAVGIGCCGGAVLLLCGGEKADAARWRRWMPAPAGANLLIRAVTAGVLGLALARTQERPFFLMAVGLGQTARVEGLVTAVWLLADVTLAGLMLQSGKRLWCELGLSEAWGAWVTALAALGTALALNGAGSMGFWMEIVLPWSSLALWGGVPVLGCLMPRKSGDALQ